MWGCRAHWFTLPPTIRSAIWATYKQGQEVTKTPSAAYLEVAKYAHKWAIAHQKEDTKAEEEAKGRIHLLMQSLSLSTSNDRRKL